LAAQQDPGGVGDRLDAKLLEVVAGADAGQHQQLGRVDCAGAEDDLAPGLHRGLREQVRGQVLDRGSAPGFDRHPLGPAAGPDLQVRPGADDRVQVACEEDIRVLSGAELIWNQPAPLVTV
jgi:hypothetical protein